jgi:cytochrome c oxidase subunit 4
VREEAVERPIGAGDQADPGALAAEQELAAHPTPRTYVMVAVALAVATLFEVGLYYLGGIPRGLLIGLLLFFMVLKFGLVVLWFMHLRFDSPLFRRLFVAGLLLALSVYVIVLLTFGTFEFPDILLAIGVVAGAAVVLYSLRAIRERTA